MSLLRIFMAAAGAAAQAAPVVACPDLAPQASSIDPSSATAFATIKRNGVAQATGSSDVDWVAPKSSTIGDNYEVKIEYVSGSDLIGGLSKGVWYGITEDRQWSYTSAGSGPWTGVYTLSFRPAGGGATLDTATVTFLVEQIVA